MSSSDAASGQRHLGSFWKGLAGHGFKEGENVRAEYRWADGQYDRLSVLAGELVSIPVQALVCLENTATAIAAKKATSTSLIPVVFAIGTDPIRFGLVKNLSHPGENITGVVNLTVGLAVKRFQVLTELLGPSARVGVLLNPSNPAADTETKAIVGEATKRPMQPPLDLTGSHTAVRKDGSLDPFVSSVGVPTLEGFLRSRRRSKV